MKKMFFVGCVLLVFSAAALAAQPSFSAGIGLLEVPGLFDSNLLAKYDSLANNAGVTLVNPASPQAQSIMGFHAMAQTTWSGFMARVSVMLGNGMGLTYYYDEPPSGRVTVDNRLLMAATTLWIGPIVEVAQLGSAYVCLGPTYLYGEYRDKKTVEGRDDLSWDRQYGGGGIVVPLMVGVEVRPLRWLGVAVEGVALGQQVIITTTSKADLAAAGVEHDSKLFPSVLYGLFPVSYWVQLTFSFHF